MPSAIVYPQLFCIKNVTLQQLKVYICTLRWALGMTRPRNFLCVGNCVRAIGWFDYFNLVVPYTAPSKKNRLLAYFCCVGIIELLWWVYILYGHRPLCGIHELNIHFWYNIPVSAHIRYLNWINKTLMRSFIQIQIV